MPEIEGWKQTSIDECGEELVSFAELGLTYLPFYSGLHDASPYQPGELAAPDGVFVRKSVGEKYVNANDSLPDTLTIVGLDGIRLPATQLGLFETYYEALKLQNRDWSEQELVDFTQQFVSMPSNDQRCPAPHTTGAVADAWMLLLPEGINKHTADNDTILRYGMWLPAGAPFDHGGERAATRYFEHNEEAGSHIAQRNRRIYYWIMQLVDISVFPYEYWHASYGDQIWAKTRGEANAIYGQVESELMPKPFGTSGLKQSTNLPLGERISPAQS
jgi:D-alanyl-D-alanine dipeptidase